MTRAWAELNVNLYCYHMEKFVVSARKYRPSTFDSVVGQRSITDTLKNAIKTNHLAQAFLFCGSRGVGKTTCARILAKTINCQNRTEDMEPCNKCDSCLSFNEGTSLNILEMDAASNNSVDNIRELTDQVRFAPQVGDYKVYIIDEVHMLSQAAFNAFLKTLEEPPAHAIFILATTEKHKIIPTILSRCQIFDFNRIRVEDISAHLSSIAQKEGIEAEEEALHIVAQKADGALRDALSIFDQLVSFSGQKLTYQDVITNLNILDYDYYFKATDILNQGNIPAALLLFDEIRKRGFDGHLFINGLASHLRNVLVCQDEQTLGLLEAAPAVKDRYREQSGNVSPDFIMKSLDICAQCDAQYKGSKNQRLLVELSLMQMASINSASTTAVEKKKHRIASPEAIASVQSTDSQSSDLKSTDLQSEDPQSEDLQSEEKSVVRDSEVRDSEVQSSEVQSSEVQTVENASSSKENPIPDPQSPVSNDQSEDLQSKEKSVVRDSEVQKSEVQKDDLQREEQTNISTPLDVTANKNEIQEESISDLRSPVSDDQSTDSQSTDLQSEDLQSEEKTKIEEDSISDLQSPISTEKPEAGSQKPETFAESSQKAENPAPKKAIVSNIQPTRTRSLSINALTTDSGKDEATEASEAYTSEDRNQFDQEKLMDVWTALIKKIQIEAWEGASMIISAMSSREPKLQDDFKIAVLVDNKSQAEELMLRRTDLHDYLRKKLANGAIEVVVEVNKNEELKKAYTDEEKFKEMAEDNPNILKLRQQFDLDFL